ncbi:epimerase [Chryseobacterium wanjuense]
MELSDADGWDPVLQNICSRKYEISCHDKNPRKSRTASKSWYSAFLVDFSDDEKISKYLHPTLLSQNPEVIIITVPFSKKMMAEFLHNRFENISLYIKGFKGQLFLMSSVGIYPQQPIEIAEDSLPDDQLNQSMLSVEKIVKEKFPQVNILRLGGLMGDNRVFSNYSILSPEQVVNHVHYHDICRIIETMMKQNISSKTYNVVAPLHPVKQEVINYQKDLSAPIDFLPEGRKIISKLIEKDLGFSYVYPDPKKFTEAI